MHAGILGAVAFLAVGCGKPTAYEIDTSAGRLSTTTTPPNRPHGTNTDTDGHTDTDTDTDTGPDGHPPTVSNADAVCYYNDSSPSYWYWLVYCQFDDPEGRDTIASFYSGFEHEVTVLQEGTQVARYTLACGEGGDCSAGFDEDDDGILCSSASSYTFRFVVYDEDGNASEPVEVNGRAG